jgi:hypothetical protein
MSTASSAVPQQSNVGASVQPSEAEDVQNSSKDKLDDRSSSSNDNDSGDSDDSDDSDDSETNVGGKGEIGSPVTTEQQPLKPAPTKQDQQPAKEKSFLGGPVFSSLQSKERDDRYDCTVFSVVIRVS